MKVESFRDDYFKITHATRAVIRWIKEEIPDTHRFYDTPAWYVHEKYMDGVYQLGAEAPPHTTDWGSDDYAILHLRADAPMVIITAAWRALAKLHHPDCGGDVESFQRCKNAYDRIRKIRGGR